MAALVPVAVEVSVKALVACSTPVNIEVPVPVPKLIPVPNKGVVICSSPKPIFIPKPPLVSKAVVVPTSVVV